MNMQQRLALQIAALACFSGLASAVWVVNVPSDGNTMPWPSGECILMGADEEEKFTHSQKWTCEDKDTVTLQYWKTYDCSGQPYKEHPSLKFADHMQGFSCSEVSSYDGYLMHVTFKGTDCSADTICEAGAMPLNHCMPMGTASMKYVETPTGISMQWYESSTSCSGTSQAMPMAKGACTSIEDGEKENPACGHQKYILPDQLSALQASRSDKADSPKNSTEHEKADSPKNSTEHEGTMMTCGAVAKAYKASKCCKNPTAKFYMEKGMDEMAMDKSGSGEKRLLQSGDTFETSKKDLFKALHTTMSRMEPDKARALASHIKDVLAGYTRPAAELEVV